MSKRGLLMAVTLTMLLIAATVATGQEESQKAKGKVVSVNEETLEIKIKKKNEEAKTMTFVINEDTGFKQGKKKASLEDVKVGKKVSVEYEEVEDQLVAKLVTISKDKKDKKKKKKAPEGGVSLRPPAGLDDVCSSTIVWP